MSMSDRVDQAMARASPDISISSNRVVIRATPRCWLRELRRPDFRKRTLWRCIRVPPLRLLVHAEITRVDHYGGALYVIVALVKIVVERLVAQGAAAPTHRNADRADLSPIVVKTIGWIRCGVVAVAGGDVVPRTHFKSDDLLRDDVGPGRSSAHQLWVGGVGGVNTVRGGCHPQDPCAAAELMHELVIRSVTQIHVNSQRVSDVGSSGIVLEVYLAPIGGSVLANTYAHHRRAVGRNHQDVVSTVKISSQCG